MDQICCEGIVKKTMSVYVLTCDLNNVVHAHEGKGQEDVSDILGGPITLVGAIPELDVVIASLRAAGTDVHPLVAKQPSFFHEDAHGTLAFVATDAEGEESTIDLDKLMTHLTDCTPSFQS